MHSSLLFIVFFLAFAIASQDSNPYSSLEAFDESIGQEDTDLLAEVNNLDLSVAEKCSDQNTPNSRVRARNTKSRLCGIPKFKWYYNPFKSVEEFRDSITQTNIGGRNDFCVSITRGLLPVAVCDSGDLEDRRAWGIDWFPYRVFRLQNARLGKKRCHDHVVKFDFLNCSTN